MDSRACFLFCSLAIFAFSCSDPKSNPDTGVSISTHHGDLGVLPDTGITTDTGPRDTGGTDLSVEDTGAPPVDGGPEDLGAPIPDMGSDAGIDVGPPDMGPPDLGPPDLGPPDLGAPDLGPPDMGFPDLGINPSPQMSFFVTSEGSGAAGGNFGGLAGADARCQSLALTVGAGARTWRAYLSVHPSAGGSVAVDARDRIGQGPWFDFNGTMVAQDLTALHAAGVPSPQMLSERGTVVPMNEHDIITGSRADGTAWPNFPGNPAAPSPTCFNWTDGTINGFVYVGHADWSDPNTIGNPVWNASHGTDCSEAGLLSTAGSGRIYCFAE